MDSRLQLTSNLLLLCLSSGNSPARPFHFPSGNIWPAFDQKPMTSCQRACQPKPSSVPRIWSSLRYSTDPPHSSPQPSSVELYCQTDVSPDPRSPRHTAKRKKGAAVGVGLAGGWGELKESAVYEGLPESETALWHPPTLPCLFLQAGSRCAHFCLLTLFSH